MEIQEEELLIENAKKDPIYFGAIYKAYVGDVYRYCYSLLRDKEKAEDAVSDAFLLASTHLKTYLPRGKSIKCWLFTIARNQVLKAMKSYPTGAIYDCDLCDPQDNFLDMLINADQTAMITTVLNNLPPLRSEIIRLKIWDDLTFEAIADITKMNLSTVKMTYYRSLKQLRDEVEKVRSINTNPRFS